MLKDGEQFLTGNKRGLHLAIFQGVTGEKLLQESFDTHGSSLASDSFAAAIESTAVGNTVLIGVLDEATNHLTKRAKRAIRSVGSSQVNLIGYRGSWACIGRKGLAPGSAAEQVNNCGTASIKGSAHLQTAEESGFTVTAKSAGKNEGNYAKIEMNGTEVSFPNGTQRGMNLVVFDEKGGSVLHKESFDTHASSSNSAAFVDFINTLPAGRVVAIAIKDEATNCLTEAAKRACESLGSTLIRSIAYRGSWAIVGQKGIDIGSVPEAGANHSSAQCSSWLPTNPGIYKGFNVSVRSAGFKKGVNTEIAVNGNQSLSSYHRGISVAVIEEINGIIEQSETFDTYASQSNSSALAKLIDEVPTGKLVVACIYDEGSRSLSSEAKKALEHIGSSLIHNISYRDSWAIIGRKGSAPGSVPEVLDQDGCASLSLWVDKGSDSGFAHPVYSLHVRSAGLPYLRKSKVTITLDDREFFTNNGSYGRGLNVVAFSGQTNQLVETGQFDTHGDYNQSSNFVEFLNKLANGTVVAIAVYDEATSSLSSAAFKAIESLGSEKIRQLQYRGSWAFIGVKGHPQKKVESLSNTSDAEAKFWIPVLGFDSITEDAGGFLVKAESAGKEVGNYAAISGQQNLVSIPGGYARGMNVVVFDQENGSVENTSHFDTHGSCVEADNLARLIESLPSGRIVAVAVLDEGNNELTERAKLALESIGSARIRKLGYRQSWCIIGIKGAAPGSVPESDIGKKPFGISTYLYFQGTTSRHGRRLFAFAGAALVGIGIAAVARLAFESYYLSHLTEPELVVIPIQPAASTSVSKRRAVFVGINYSKNQSTPLNGGPPRMAKELKEAMINSSLFEEEECKILSDEPAPDMGSELWPTKKNVLKALHWLLDGARDGDVCLFYYVGHGGTNMPLDPDSPDRQEYLNTLNDSTNGLDVLYDTEFSKLSSNLSNKVNFTVILHACHSGGISDNVPAIPGTGPKGITLSAVDHTIPAVFDKQISQYIRRIVKRIKRKGTIPTYRSVINELCEEIPYQHGLNAIRQKPRIYYNNDLYDIDTLKFLQPIP